MIEIIKKALHVAYGKAIASAPTTRKQRQELSITEVKPIDLASFMARNNIPNTAWFGGSDNGYDGWDDLLILWEIDVPMSPTDTKLEVQHTFGRSAYTAISMEMRSNGYTPTPYTRELHVIRKAFDICKSYENSDWNAIHDHFKLYFKED